MWFLMWCISCSIFCMLALVAHYNTFLCKETIKWFNWTLNLNPWLCWPKCNLHAHRPLFAKKCSKHFVIMRSGDFWEAEKVDGQQARTIIDFCIMLDNWTVAEPTPRFQYGPRNASFAPAASVFPLFSIVIKRKKIYIFLSLYIELRLCRCSNTFVWHMYIWHY